MSKGALKQEEDARHADTQRLQTSVNELQASQSSLKVLSVCLKTDRRPGLEKALV